MKNTNRALRTNHTRPGTRVNGNTASGGSHPPRNRMVHMAHMVQIAAYSPSMNIMYGVEPYSTMKPATSSDSASTRSKGGRLVSASAETKKTMNIGNNGSQYQFNIVNHGRPRRWASPDVAWASTMSLRLSEPAHSNTVIMTKPMETSYETICAAERNADRNGYLEFDAQPPMMMP